jgi:hypothetical protein
MVTEQRITDQAKYEKEFAPAAIKTIKDVTGWESLDDVKKWQGGEYAKLIPIRDQSAKVRQFAVPCSKSYLEALFLMLIARRRPFAVRKKYGDGFPSRSLIIGWGPVSTWWLHNAEFNSASKPEETIAPSDASPPCSNIQIIKSDRRDARLIIMETSRSSVRLAEVAISFDIVGCCSPS